MVRRGQDVDVREVIGNGQGADHWEPSTNTSAPAERAISLMAATSDRCPVAV